MEAISISVNNSFLDIGDKYFFSSLFDFFLPPGAERLAETLNDTKENAKAFTKSFLGKVKGI